MTQRSDSETKATFFTNALSHDGKKQEKETNCYMKHNKIH